MRTGASAGRTPSNKKHSTYENSSFCDPKSLSEAPCVFSNCSPRKTMFFHRRHNVCDYNQATKRPQRIAAVWSAKTSLAQFQGMAVK
ncbi:hypothetical protein EVAR_629_1 [Eumeta japonica]|uniref:Uncharacterized protein n=1 Tax=Eumeta variegata TaxID=151549 RepID=A0A4C1SBD7_EUMVA|nr:hypothetical protein EVAR_629_1 [Eumeta japonica]